MLSYKLNSAIELAFRYCAPVPKRVSDVRTPALYRSARADLQSQVRYWSNQICNVVHRFPHYWKGSRKTFSFEVSLPSKMYATAM